MSFSDAFSSSGRDLRLWGKLRSLNWGVVALVTAISCIGFGLLYSVAGGSFEPWAERQMVRFAIGMALLIGVALINLRTWFQLAYPIYGVSLLLLVAVEFVGRMGKGAERWIDIGPLQLQPSELMKIALILALSRFLHGVLLDDVSRPTRLLPALLLIVMPAGLVLLQPNLGTAAILIAGGCGLIFLAGLSWKIIVPVIVLGLAVVPIGWEFALKDYQKERVYTFLDPDSDPLGAGYNITQSKIALGSGGIFGKGFGQGTQSRLNFLPEKQTDFIFTVLGEEFGLFGLMILMGLYLALLIQGLRIALSTRSQFGRLVAMGVCLNFLLYILINTSMSMGLIPVVGIPLPLVSYGGTALLTVLFGFGLLLSVQIHRSVDIPRSASGLWSS
ncbi:MAG: rod shape-determining protein RodA [Alphaproteobacteria bacterium]|nr:rod shape-determining protein RodA [Alphaproteobacteria bacterium]